ncbi:SPOR domain-containing protein [Solidesulfovibrio sp.]
MKLLSRLNASRENGGPRKFTLEISMPGIVSVGIVVVLGMCWVFILGILVGRGYRPEAAVPQIAQMMPTTEALMPDNTTAQAPPTVLKPEDLQFMEDMPGHQAGVEAPSVKAPADPKKAPVPAKPHEQTEVRPVPAAARPAPTPPKPAAAAAVDPKTPFDKPSQTRYTATYQVASFPGREQAETHVKQLAKKGITASISEAKSNKNPVFRVNVQLKGSDAEIAEGLKRTGEKGPILLGKKPL